MGLKSATPFVGRGGAFDSRHDTDLSGVRQPLFRRRLQGRSAGRVVRCASCGNRWTARNEDALDLFEEPSAADLAAADVLSKVWTARTWSTRRPPVSALPGEELPKVFRARADAERRLREAKTTGVIWAGMAAAMAVMFVRLSSASMSSAGPAEHGGRLRLRQSAGEHRRPGASNSSRPSRSWRTATPPSSSPASAQHHRHDRSRAAAAGRAAERARQARGRPAGRRRRSQDPAQRDPPLLGPCLDPPRTANTWRSASPEPGAAKHGESRRA
jgi:hypothetical protein